MIGLKNCSTMNYQKWVGFFMSIIILVPLHLTAQVAPKAILTSTQYQTLLKEYFDENGPGAALLVAKKGEVVYQGAIGKANIELNVPMITQHVFRIASLSKQFTAVAILMLMEHGQLDLQEDIQTYLPQYPSQGHSITIEHLLTHTSGIPSVSDLPAWEEHIRDDLTTSEMIALFKNKPLDFVPGTANNYSNSGYFLLGVIIEKISGLSYADFIQKNIFDKVGMGNSYYSEAKKIIPMRASGYRRGYDGYVNAPYISMSLPFSTGALAMNVFDFYKWNEALMNGRLISTATVTKAHSQYQLSKGEFIETGYGWGLGKFFGQPTIEHGGSLFGFLSYASYLPEEELLVVIFSNCDCQNPEPVLNKVLGIETKNYSLKKKINLSQKTLTEYVGVYTSDAGSEKRSIQLKGNQLTYQIGNGEVYNLYPYEKDRFYFKDYLTTFHFTRDEEEGIDGIVSVHTGGTNKMKKTDKSLAFQPIIDVSPITLKLYVGKYEMEADFPVEITLENDVLMGTSPGQAKMRLYATTKTRFFVKEMDATLEFIQGKEGHFSKLKLVMSGQVINGTKTIN